MNLREFVELVRKAVGPHGSRVLPTFVECDKGGASAYLWTFAAVNEGSSVWRWLSESVYVAVIYPDGSVQLLSRDEDECLLFQTLWELEK